MKLTIWENIFEKTIVLIFILLSILLAIMIIEDVIANIGDDTPRVIGINTASNDTTTIADLFHLLDDNITYRHFFIYNDTLISNFESAFLFRQKYCMAATCLEGIALDEKNISDNISFAYREATYTSSIVNANITFSLNTTDERMKLSFGITSKNMLFPQNTNISYVTYNLSLSQSSSNTYIRIDGKSYNVSQNRIFYVSNITKKTFMIYDRYVKPRMELWWEDNATIKVQNGEIWLNFEVRNLAKDKSINKTIWFLDDIFAEKIEHWGSSKEFISDFTKEGTTEDNITYIVPNNEYAKVWFSQNLTDNNAIDFVANATNGRVEVYLNDSDVLVGYMNNVTAYGTYIISLNMGGQLSDNFLLKSIGDIEYDFIHDQIMTCNMGTFSSSMNELDTLTINSSCSTDNFGVGSYTWVVNLELDDKDKQRTKVNGTCGGNNDFNITSITFTCPSGQTCTADRTAGTATLTWAKSKTGTIVWNVLACSGSSSYSPYNITQNETSVNGDSMTGRAAITVAAPPDTTLPSVLQQYPANNSINNTGTVNFNCSATDNTNLNNISLWSNFTGTWALNDSWCNVTGTVGSCQWNKTLPSNTYIWGCRAFDAANNSNWTMQNWTVIVDTLSPTFSNALNSSGWQYDNVTMNITISNNAVDGYIFSTNITGTWTNDSWVDITSNPTTYNANTTKNISLAAGVSYGWKYYANDTVANIGESIVYNATVKTDIMPNVSLISPADGTTSVLTNFTFKAAGTDDRALVNATFYWNYSGTWLPNGTVTVSGTSAQANFTRDNLAVNSYIWNVQFCDNNGACNFSLSNYTLTIRAATKYCAGNYTEGQATWNITSNITCANQTIYVAGNITIFNNGSLTLRNVTINFSAFADGSNFINKSPNGGLYIYDLDSNSSTQEDATEIISNNSDYEYDFWAFGNGLNDNLTIRNSKFTDAGYTTKSQGIQLYNVSNVVVSGNNVSGGAYYGLYLQYSANNNLSSNTITTTSSIGYGIFLTTSSNSTLQSNTITTSGTNGYGIYLSSSSNSTLQSNTITTSGVLGFGYGIYLLSSSTNTLQSNTITTSGSSAYGIYLSSSSNSNVSSNTITTTTSSSYGIYLSTSSNSNTLQSNTITTNGTSGYGIYLDTSSNNNATGNTINATGANADGIYIWSNSDNNIFNLNNISKSGRDGIRIENSGTSIPERNNITNNIILNATEHGIFVNNALNAFQLIQGNNISYSGNFSILLRNASNITIIGGSLGYSKIGVNATSSRNVTVTNATFVLNTLWDFYITNNSWITSLNNTFNKTLVNVTGIAGGGDYSNFTVKWYVTITTDQNPANANSTNLNESIAEYTDQTTPTGLLVVKEYLQNATSFYNYTYNFSATKSGYDVGFNVTAVHYTQTISLTLNPLEEVRRFTSLYFLDSNNEITALNEPIMMSGMKRFLYFLSFIWNKLMQMVI